MFLEVCPNPEDWSRSCSPCKIDYRLIVRHTQMARFWWSDRGLKTNEEKHSAVFVIEEDN